MSFGPPIPPSPHLLPYLYPGMYPGGSGLGGPLCPSALSPTTNLLFNAQLALAAHHPGSLFTQAYLQGAAAGGAGVGSGGAGGHPFKMTTGGLAAAAAAGLGRFHPYHLGLHHPHHPSSVGSAFETVTPGRCSSAGSTPPPAPLDLQSPVNGGRQTSPPVSAAASAQQQPPPRQSSVSPSQRHHLGHLPPPPPSHHHHHHGHRPVAAPNHRQQQPAASSPPPPPPPAQPPQPQPTSSDLKSIEKMVNGLDSVTAAVVTPAVQAAVVADEQQQVAAAVK